MIEEEEEQDQLRFGVLITLQYITVQYSTVEYNNPCPPPPTHTHGVLCTYEKHMNVIFVWKKKKKKKVHLKTHALQGGVWTLSISALNPPKWIYGHQWGKTNSSGLTMGKCIYKFPHPLQLGKLATGKKMSCFLAPNIFFQELPYILQNHPKQYGISQTPLLRTMSTDNQLFLCDGFPLSFIHLDILFRLHDPHSLMQHSSFIQYCTLHYSIVLYSTVLLLLSLYQKH